MGIYADMAENERRAKRQREEWARVEAKYRAGNSGYQPSGRTGQGSRNTPDGRARSAPHGRLRLVLLVLFLLHFVLFPLFGLPNIFGLL